MSKAALYAGLGQGLMALGQGLGNAFNQMTLEKMRKQSQAELWARQDKIRAEDLAYKKDRDAKTDAHRQEQIALQKSQVDGQTNRDIQQHEAMMEQREQQHIERMQQLKLADEKNRTTLASKWYGEENRKLVAIDKERQDIMKDTLLDDDAKAARLLEIDNKVELHERGVLVAYGSEDMLERIKGTPLEGEVRRLMVKYGNEESDTDSPVDDGPDVASKVEAFRSGKGSGGLMDDTEYKRQTLLRKIEELERKLNAATTAPRAKDGIREQIVRTRAELNSL